MFGFLNSETGIVCPISQVQWRKHTTVLTSQGEGVVSVLRTVERRRSQNTGSAPMESASGHTHTPRAMTLGKTLLPSQPCSCELGQGCEVLSGRPSFFLLTKKSRGLLPTPPQSFLISCMHTSLVSLGWGSEAEGGQGRSGTDTPWACCGHTVIACVPRCS